MLHTSKTLSEEEARTLGALDLTMIQKRPATGHTPASEDVQRVELERALLEVGLLNLHHEAGR